MGWILCCSAEGQASSDCDGQVKSPEGVGCSRWTHSWNDDQDLRQMPGPSDPAPPRSSNNVYFLSDEANTKGLYIYDTAPNWAGTHCKCSSSLDCAVFFSKVQQKLLLHVTYGRLGEQRERWERSVPVHRHV